MATYSLSSIAGISSNLPNTVANFTYIGADGANATLYNFADISIPSGKIISKIELKGSTNLSEASSMGATISVNTSSWTAGVVTYNSKPSTEFVKSVTLPSGASAFTYDITGINTGSLDNFGITISSSASGIQEITSCYIEVTFVDAPPLVITGEAFYATDNAHIDSANASVNYQNVIKTGSTFNGFIKFAPIIIPSGKVINTINLKIKPKTASSASIPLNYVEEPWYGNILTFNNRPPTLLYKSISIDSTTNYNTIDISTVDVTKLNSTGLCLGSQSATKEFEIATSAQPPYLDVTFKDAPPSEPYIVSPVTGDVIDKGQSLKIEWNSTGTQFSYEIGYSTNGTSYTFTNLESANKEHSFTANLFSNGNLYIKVRYKTSSAGEYSVYSAPILIKASTKPTTPSLVTTGAITTALPTITWTSSSQSGFEIVLTGPTTQTINITDTSLLYTLTTPLMDNSTYTLKLRVRNSDGLYSDYDTETITTNFTKPAKPTMTVTPTNDLFIKIKPTNSDSATNDIYKIINGVSTRIATGFASNQEFNDYRVASGETYEYFIRAYSPQLGFVDSDHDSKSITLNHGDLITVDNVTNIQFINSVAKSISSSIASTDFQLAGRSKPVREFSVNTNKEISLTFEVMTLAEVKTIENMAMSKKIIAYRDYRGRLLYISFDGIDVEDINHSFVISLNNCIEVDYSEVV